MNVFEIATRLKYRFPSSIGNLSVEDLWELPLSSKTKANLDDVAKAINRTIKNTEEESFVAVSTGVNQVATNKMKVVMFIIHTKVAEELASAQRLENKKEEFKLRSAIESKKDSAREAMCMEDLERQLAKLKG